MRLLSAGPWEKTADGRRRAIRYEALFWEGPERVGDKGRYVTMQCNDVLFDQPKRRLANTSPGVSYYSDLMKRALAA